MDVNYLLRSTANVSVCCCGMVRVCVCVCVYVRVCVCGCVGLLFVCSCVGSHSPLLYSAVVQCKNLKLYKDTVEMYRRSLECLESRKTDLNFKRFLEVRTFKQSVCSFWYFSFRMFDSLWPHSTKMYQMSMVRQCWYNTLLLFTVSCCCCLQICWEDLWRDYRATHSYLM